MQLAELQQMMLDTMQAFGRSRIKRGSQDVEQIVEQLRHFSVFNHHGHDLIRIANTYVVAEYINR